MELESLYDSIFMATPVHELLDKERQLRTDADRVLEEQEFMRAKLQVVKTAPKTLETTKEHADAAVAHIDSAVQHNRNTDPKHSKYHLPKDQVSLIAAGTPVQLSSSS